MPMLPSRNYVSDHTRFIRELVAAKPDLPQQQQEGRRIWWDRTADEVNERRRMDEGRVAQKPYVYQTGT